MKTINIISGPSREELFDALRLLAHVTDVPFVIICEDKKYTLHARITGIKAEDGSGHSWNITINVFSNLEKDFVKLFSEVYTKGKEVLCFGVYYSTKTRLGHFDFN